MIKIPLDTNQTPNTIHELIFRLKVKDVMNKKVYTSSKNETLRKVQKAMKKTKVTGIPIIDKEKLVGLVSMDDIVNAFDKGHIDDPTHKHMTKKVISLKDDMPLTIAISYFHKFKFGRYPVLNKEKKLVGIISSGDIISKLLIELNKEVRILEKKLPSKKKSNREKIDRQYNIKKLDFENAGKVSTEIKKLLQDRGVNSKILRKVAIASYELEINMVIHSKGGKMSFILNDKKIEIIAEDRGPGISDIKMALKEGFTTAGPTIKSLGFGAGMGLPNIKRVSDRFKITSELKKGTIVKVVIYLKSQEAK